MRTLYPGFHVGHWTSPGEVSGCTVILPPRDNVTSYDVRGSSPSTRELEHLHPDRKLTEVHAILLTGSSAFGLAAADGVVAWLEERARGYETPIGVVPIVPGAVIFDLGVAQRGARPGAEAGRSACEAATETEVSCGRVGAGTGATAGKWAGREWMVPGGLGLGHAERYGWSVGALAVVNPLGDVMAEDGSVLAGTRNPAPDPRSFAAPGEAGGPTQATVLVCVATAANLDKRDVRFLAARGSDGVTSCVRPAHTRYDGDVTFAAAGPDPSGRPPDLDILGYLASEAVTAAVRDAVR